MDVIREAMLGLQRPVRDLVTARGTSSARVRAYFDEGRDAFGREAGTLDHLGTHHPGPSRGSPQDHHPEGSAHGHLKLGEQAQRDVETRFGSPQSYT